MGGAGFSLLELLVSVALITLLMSAVFSFMYQCQNRFQSNSVAAESNQTARAALEVMSQEIGQAGYNPQFYPYRTATSPIPAQSAAYCVTLNDISMINPQDWLQVDTGASMELVQVTATSNNASSCKSPSPTPSSPWIQAVFEIPHSPSGSPSVIPFLSYKFPYPTGIILGTSGTNSDDHDLLFYGDINNDGVIRYVKYSLNPTTNPATTVNITTGAYAGTYTLYNLYRSITPVGFPNVTTYTPRSNYPASILVQNVLYDVNAMRGPAGQPVFYFPPAQEYQVGVYPSYITVVGTVVITISVAVNPRALEAGIIQWYTMATQIRPLNLFAAVAINQASGFMYMSKLPYDLPMNNPTNYYQ